MTDHKPTADVEFILSLIRDNDKVLGLVEFEKSKAYILKGDQPIAKRTIIFPVDSDQIPYEIATGIALRLKCTDQLDVWYEKNRDWKEGGYIVPHE